MFSVVFDVSRWIFRRFIWFLAIVALLWAGYTIKGQLKGLADLEATLQYLKVGKSQLESEAKALGEKTGRSANSLTTAAVSQLDERIHQLEGEIEGKNQKLADLDGVLSEVPSVFRLPTGGGHATCFSGSCSRSQSLRNWDGER